MKKIITFLLILISTSCFSQEICDNGIDDDGDGKIDLNDPDCSCSQTPVPSIIPNGSFENYSACPSEYSQLNLCTGWIQASIPTTDYQNTCGFVFEAVEAAGMVPFPDGNGIAGAIIQPFYREYLGSCLSSPMLAGTNYRLTFNIASVPTTNDGTTCNNGYIIYEPINITLYGNASCSHLPVADAWRNPNATDTTWFVIGSAYYEPSTTWGELTINFTPTQNINTIILGAPEFVPPSYENDCNPYFVFDNLTLNDATSFGVTITPNGFYCQNDLSLTATLTSPVSGTPAYQWYKNGIAITGQTNSVLAIEGIPSNLTDYTVRVTDADGCNTSNTYRVYDVIPAPDFTYVEPTCVTMTGSITIATPAAFYSFDNGTTWVTSPIKNNLQPGLYYLRTKSSTGCISENSMIGLYMPVVEDYPEYTLSSVTCSSVGNITITSIADEYSFDGGVTWQQSNVLQSPELNRLYHLVMRSSDGCVSNTSYAYANTDGSLPLAPQINITQPLSCNEQTGIITGVYDDFDFSFDNGVTWTTDNVSGALLPGTYQVRTRYPNGCISPPTIAVINAPADAPAPPLFAVTDPTCSIQTGSITITTPGAQYSFDNGVTWLTSNLKSGLAPGSYNLKIKNADGCQSNPSIALISSETGPPYAPAFSVIQPNCYTTTGTITITVNSFEYSFDNGTTWINNNVSPALPVGIHKIKIKNAAGCESPLVEVIITPDIVLPPAATDIIYCKDSSSSPLVAIGTNLSWYTTATGGTASVNAPIPSTAIAGISSYFVTQTINGCESERLQINVEVIEKLNPPVILSEITYCQDETPALLTASGTNLLWYSSPDSINGSPTAPVPSTVAPGRFTYYVTQSAYGCESDMAAITVIVNPTPAPPETEEYIVYQHHTPTILLSAIGSNLAWYDKDKVRVNAAPLPSSNFIGLNNYYVSQIVDGCESELVKIQIEIVQNYATINYPKFFSPNSDGLHDTWNIHTIPNGIKASIFIFDRYGKVLTNLTSPGAGWDGTYNGRNLPATDYWFKVIYFEYGIEKEFRSHFSLIR